MKENVINCGDKMTAKHITFGEEGSERDFIIYYPEDPIKNPWVAYEIDKEANRISDKFEEGTYLMLIRALERYCG